MTSLVATWVDIDMSEENIDISKELKLVETNVPLSEDEDGPKFEHLYTKSIIGFIDIQGFKSHIKSNMSETQKVWHMHDVINNLNQVGDVVEFKKACSFNNLDVKNLSEDIIQDSIKITSFSDCIVISCPATASDHINVICSYMIYLVSYYCVSLLKIGFLTRGGIAHGDCIHQAMEKKSDVVFGPAMLEAYELESIHAKSPRVILHHNAQKFFSSLPDLYKDFIYKIVAQDQDGPYWVNPYSCIKEKYLSNVINNTEAISFLNSVKIHIQTGLDDFHHNPSIYAHYKWALSKCNQAINEIINNNQ